MQLMPLQDLDVGLFEIETAGKDPGDFLVAVQNTRAPEQFHDTAVFAELDRAVLLGDEVGVIFDTHGRIA